MEAAIIATSRGHDVELYEKETKLGGQSFLVAKPPGMERFLDIMDFWLNELKRLGISIYLNRELTVEDILKRQPDVVILATGSIPFVPAIEGIEGRNVTNAWEVLEGKDVGKRVAVIGGGFVGLETALFLEKKGKEIVLVEKLDELMQDAGALNRARLKEEMDKIKIEVKCKTELLSVAAGKITVRSDSEKYDIPVDTVVLALGAKAVNPLQRELMGKVPELYAVGDCVEARNMIEAIHEAYDVAAAL